MTTLRDVVAGSGRRFGAMRARWSADRMSRTTSSRRRQAAMVFAVLASVVALVAASTEPTRAATADAAKGFAVRQFSPQGEVATVRQARATFNVPMVDFGNVQQPAPFDIGCAAAGSGRWINDRTWVYDFAADLGPGTRCAFDLKADFRSRDGGAATGKTKFAFSTGGPAIVRNFPAAGDGGPAIDEEQVFVLVLNGPATPASVTANAWCEISGVGERVPVRLVGGADRDALLQRFSLGSKADDVVLLNCARRLPNGAKVALVWGRGIAAASGIATTVERRLRFEVRADFTASFGCERENAQAACTPVRPVHVDFTSPVPRTIAERFVLRDVDAGKTREHRPSFDPDDRANAVSSIEFKPPFAESSELTIEAPKDLVDDGGRGLSNASLFPLKSRTAAAPPLAKFAAAPFGILELNADPVLPLTVRHVEPSLTIRGVTVSGSAASSDTPKPTSRGTVRTVNVDGSDDDAALIDWQRRVKHLHETTIPRAQVDPADLVPTTAMAPQAGERERVGRHVRNEAQQARAEAVAEHDIGSRELSLLRRDPRARPLALPAAKGDDPRPFEVVGIPLPEPGFHIVEVESQRLGAALLGKPAPMFVRTTALVTNLGVHAKFGRVNAGIWVTTLDRAKPVPDAIVRISDCRGRSLWQGTTDARGFAFVARAFPSPASGTCGEDGETGYFVSARKPIATGPGAGRTDVAFVWSNWNEGIESWRFNLRGAYAGGDDVDAAADADGDVRSDADDGEAGGRGRIVAHTVFDRTLLRAGQTVSMKHFLRRETLSTLSLVDAASLPTQVVITHVGSDEEFTFDLAWRGGRYAETTFRLPDDAKLGLYQVALELGDRRFDTGSFRVEEFRLPAMRGRIDVRAPDQEAAGTKAPRDFVRPSSLATIVSIGYTNGGSAAALPVRVSAAVQPRFPMFAGWDGYSFSHAERDDRDDAVPFDDFVEDGPRYARESPGQRVVADKLAVALDKDGNGRVVLDHLPPTDAPRALLVEATYPDPNGEIQTLSQTVSLWPAALAVGVKAGDWVSVHGKSDVRMVVVDTTGKPVANAPVELRGVAHRVRSIRKRMVGGFYAYDNQRESSELGVLCSGKSNGQGLLICSTSIGEPGEVELVATVKDAAGNTARASASIWVTRQAEVWFGGENQDRIDVLPEKKVYAPGEIAKFQLRMPFRAATALVAIERDGILATQVVDVRGDDPTVAVRIEPDWAPNVFVSVLAVRGRIRDVPWYSFFTWGWRSPTEWWRAWRDEGKLYEPPTALVDLGKPAFKYGIAAIAVDKAAHRLNVAVTTDRPDYPVRAIAKATVRVTDANGKPVPAGTEVAVAAVDEALLELMPNASWDLLDAMIRERSYAVETATAQMQIVGKRHFGRKAAPPGGGGGVTPTRELFDTLLVWKPTVVLDADGSATIDVPLNDSLTAFRIVAVADAGTSAFGNGSATIRSRQDLQIVAGLPPLVREGDRYLAGITLRNTTKTAMDVVVDATAAPGGSVATADRAVAAAAAKAPNGPPGRDRRGAAKPAAESGGPGTPAVAPKADEPAASRPGIPDASSADIANAAEAVAVAPLRLPTRRIHLDAEGSSSVAWPVTVPLDVASIDWRIDAKSASAADRIAVPQKVVPAVPITVQQGTLEQLDRTFALPVAAPADAVVDANGVPRGGVQVAMKARLADGLPGVVDWFRRYPYVCLEQQASIAIGTVDEKRWDDVARTIPLYLDGDGLAAYYPPRANDPASGSDVLTAYLLTVSAEASTVGRYAIPDATRTKMESGLVAFVEGRIKRNLWAPYAGDGERQLTVRKLAAIEALTRTGKATPRMLQSLQVLPNQWPTSAVIDWMLILKRLPAVPQRDARLAEADQIVRARLNYQGTRLDFSTEKDDFWYWLMASGDGNAARLVTAVVDDPAWKDDIARLVVGALQRQREGHWLTTTANVWGTLAVAEFSKRFEKEPVSGATRVAVAGGPPQTVRWGDAARGGTVDVRWPRQGAGADVAKRELQVVQDGGGKPWLTIRSLAAVPLKAPVAAGFRIVRTVTPVEQKVKNVYSRGDVVRIHLDVDVQADTAWVVLSDPVPGGATVLGNGLGRDSQLSTTGEKREGWAWPTYEEKRFDAYRGYYAFLPKGRFATEYTVRLNNAGTFNLPPTRIEAMYAPDEYGALPNAPVDVAP